MSRTNLKNHKMTLLQILRYILSAPLNLFWPGETKEEQERMELYDFVHIAWFYLFIGGMVWVAKWGM